MVLQANKAAGSVQDVRDRSMPLYNWWEGVQKSIEKREVCMGLIERICRERKEKAQSGRVASKLKPVRHEVKVTQTSSAVYHYAWLIQVTGVGRETLRHELLRPGGHRQAIARVPLPNPSRTWAVVRLGLTAAGYRRRVSLATAVTRGIFA